MSEAKLPKITPAMLKEAGLHSWQQEFMGKIGSQFIERGYTFSQWREAVHQYCYFSEQGGGGLMVRLRPQFDHDAKPCPRCNDPEIVMQPKADGEWRCPKCKGTWKQPPPPADIPSFTDRDE